MSQIAFVWNDVSIYWSNLILCCALAATILAALGLRLLQGELADAALYLPLALVFGFFGARLQHWYCFYRQYEDLRQALTDYSVGNFCLTGAIVGAILAALLLRLLRGTKDLPGLLDAAACAGALGISVGKLSAAFYSGDRGKMLFESAFLQRLPFATALTDPAGNTQWRSAVFFWESLVCFVIFLFVLALLLSGLVGKEKKRGGMAFWLFLLLFGGVEIIFDSMRYDSAFFRSNGFVSVAQVFGVLVIASGLAVFSLQGIRQDGFSLSYPVSWGLFLVGGGIMGYMEYFIQRHGERFVFAYSVMFLGLCVCLFAVIRLMQERKAEAAPADP